MGDFNTGRITMRTTPSLALLTLLALHCQGLKVRSRCRTGASCVHSQNGVGGRLEVEQDCFGANCGVNYGNQPDQRFPQSNQNNQRPFNNQGGGRVVVNDNCSSGARCTQNIGGGGRVQSSQRCTGAECGINYSQSQSAGGNYFGSGAGQMEVVNCGNGIRSVFQNEQNFIEVTCNSGRQKFSKCQAGSFTKTNNRKQVRITCAGGVGGAGGARGGGNGRVINRNCDGNNCNISIY